MEDIVDNQYYFLALNRMPKVGFKTIKKLLQRWPVLDELFQISVEELMEAGLSTRLATAIATYDKRGVELDYQWMRAGENRTILTLEDENYPMLLQEIYDPPPVLYAQGQLDCFLQPTLGIVGTRNPSVCGSEIARQFSYELAQAGLTIVSGLARGIDAQAHQGCLQAQGKTIAVMGTGMDCIYPRQHVKLVEKIVQSGLILTEFPLKTPPIAGHFPRRNRIISGLSLSLLVVESAIRSGSLSTARLALEQNRDVMAVPGSIRNPKTAGCHHLLQQGAKLVTSVHDVLEGLSIEHEKKQIHRAFANLKDTQEQLLVLMGDELITVDQLVIRSKRSVESILCDLVELELDGIVQSMPGGYMRCIL
jgi:DNA processing protein